METPFVDVLTEDGIQLAKVISIGYTSYVVRYLSRIKKRSIYFAYEAPYTIEKECIDAFYPKETTEHSLGYILDKPIRGIPGEYYYIYDPEYYPSTEYDETDDDTSSVTDSDHNISDDEE